MGDEKDESPLRPESYALLRAAAIHPAAAQNGDFYAGKTLRILVGLEAGGTVDTAARQFAVYLRKHLAGNPNILVQNMPGAGGAVATNYLAEKALPDGLTILYGPWDPLAQALGDQNLRARYEQFEFLGGTGDIRILYMRTNALAGGIKRPQDVTKADNLTVGALNYTDFSGLAPHLALKVLGVRDKMIIGYRGGADVFLAMQRGEIDVHSTSISTYRSRNASFIKEGKGIGLPTWCRSSPTAAIRRATPSPTCRPSPISTKRSAARCRRARHGTRSTG